MLFVVLRPLTIAHKPDKDFVDGWKNFTERGYFRLLHNLLQQIVRGTAVEKFYFQQGFSIASD
jgi:hypothetical protein